MKRIVVELEDGKHQAIKIKALKLEKTIKQVLTELLATWLENK